MTAGDLTELKEYNSYIACEGLWQMLMDSMAGLQTQEMWSAVLPMVAVAETLREGNTLNPVQILLLGMFLAHYFWRSFGYSLLLRGGKPTPAHIWLLACTFCILNGFLQVTGPPTPLLACNHIISQFG